jgi:hypothetical protein
MDALILLANLKLKLMVQYGILDKNLENCKNLNLEYQQTKL